MTHERLNVAGVDGSARASAVTGRAGRPEASLADRLALRYRRPLIEYFRRRGVDYAYREDLTHEVFARISRRSAHDIPNPEAYIFCSASSVYVDHIRRSSCRYADLHDDVEEYDFECDAPDAERVYRGKQAMERLNLVLEALPPKMREVVLLSKFEGLSNGQIATRLELSISSIEKYLARGLTQVRQELADHV